MPFGVHFYYTHESFLEPYMFNELENLDHNDFEVYPKIIVFLSRLILKNEGTDYGKESITE
jgi:hypothetical protein